MFRGSDLQPTCRRAGDARPRQLGCRAGSIGPPSASRASWTADDMSAAHNGRLFVASRLPRGHTAATPATAEMRPAITTVYSITERFLSACMLIGAPLIDS